MNDVKPTLVISGLLVDKSRKAVGFCPLGTANSCIRGGVNVVSVAVTVSVMVSAKGISQFGFWFGYWT